MRKRCGPGKTAGYLMRDFVYRSSRFFYRVLKNNFGPAIRSRPRLHRFGLAIQEAVKEFAGPPAIECRSPLQTDEDTSFTAAPSAAHPLAVRSELPGWLIDEWRAVHDLEPQLFPDLNIEFHIITDFIRKSNVGKYYLDLCAFFLKKPTHVLLVPWLKPGGADLVVLNYVRAISADDQAEVVVIATENSDSPWAAKLPANTRFIEFGRRYHDLSPAEQEKLLARALLQFSPRIVHNINSLLGYNLFIKYGKAITETSRLYACAFCEDITPEGRSIGYPVCFLPRCFDSLTAVLSDNQHILNKLRDIFAFGQDKLFVHYQPMTVASSVPESRGARTKDSSLDILWASRLDIQKRPDVLIKIAEKCTAMPFTFHVYGSPVYGTSEREVKYFIDSLNALPNVRYYGPFDGLPSLPTERFDLFLYTSQWDGLPNVLLEAVSMGLPVVASATGGITELINDGETGFIVAPFDNIDGYVDTLTKIHRDRSVLQGMADNALKLLKSRHSWETFREELRNVPFYFGQQKPNK
ncbi:MAG: hypothetical protein C0402_15070 [Thermodesulfovibrio sp.]|nr:hypothetical protein [Thermodesulfovibrio sp.]